MNNKHFTIKFKKIFPSGKTEEQVTVVFAKNKTLANKELKNRYKTSTRKIKIIETKIYEPTYGRITIGSIGNR